MTLLAQLSHFAWCDSGGWMTFPFELTARMVDNVIENYNGIWFIIWYDVQWQKHFTTPVAPNSWGLTHQPTSNINLTNLKFQTQQHGELDLTQPLPPNLRITHAIPAPTTSWLPASCPTTLVSNLADNAASKDIESQWLAELAGAEANSQRLADRIALKS